MSNNTFFMQNEPTPENSPIVKSLEAISANENLQIFVINTPLAESKYNYNYSDYIVVLAPRHKIMFLNLGQDDDSFQELIDDFIEDVGSIADKYLYRSAIGRPRKWREELVNSHTIDCQSTSLDIGSVVAGNKLTDALSQKKCELVLSLLTGSINDIERIKEGIPDNILDKVKQKIQLFDGDQTRFIYAHPEKKRTTIQGLSGTGKTELLLHKLKDIYVNDKESKILFTCHNKILASSLRKRIPDFFTFMKVQQQIKWEERLWCVHAWGSASSPNSGAYRYICYFYNISFQSFSYKKTFSDLCKEASDVIDDSVINEDGYAFDYVLLDESQDLPEEFIKLCEKVTKKSIYVAGDIFQSIFDEEIVSEIQPDYLLSKCYRTDPRTLMFAHALGMGLFEKNKLRWLEDEEWISCGYDIDKTSCSGSYRLSRAPLNRFEDIQTPGFESAVIIETNNNPGNTSDEKTIDIIKRIVSENPTVTPDDIGIVFTGRSSAGYAYADRLELRIKEEFDWKLNKAYESKNKVSGEIFISNKNNVKGLEFPFIICASNKVSDAPNERNALYMLLTRSFIQSYFLISSEFNKQDDLVGISDGLKLINELGALVVTNPTEEEREKIKTRIKYKSNESVFDITTSILDELIIPEGDRKPIFDIINAYPNKAGLDYVKVREIIVSNLGQMDLI